MHAALGQFSTAQEVDFISADAIAAASSNAVSSNSISYQPGSYRAPRMRGWALAAVVAAHAVLLVFVVTWKMAPVAKPAPVPLVVHAIELPSVPPPEKKPVPDPAPINVRPRIMAPTPIVATIPVPTPIQTIPVPPPPAPVIEPPAPAPATAPVRVSDALTKPIYAPPPKVPFESARNHEEGTVVLSLQIGTSGRIEQISIRKSSGFSRLDKAALDAVRRWRWSPEFRNGQPVIVVGTYSIPFQAG